MRSANATAFPDHAERETSLYLYEFYETSIAMVDISVRSRFRPGFEDKSISFTNVASLYAKTRNVSWSSFGIYI